SQDPRRHFDHDKILDYVKDKPLEFKPGSRYEYSNSDNIAVALIAEAVTKKDYEQLLSDLVYRPLNLNRTILPSGFTVPKPFIAGYDLSGKSPKDITTAISVSSVWASGGIISTP